MSGLAILGTLDQRWFVYRRNAASRSRDDVSRWKSRRVPVRSPSHLGRYGAERGAAFCVDLVIGEGDGAARRGYARKPSSKWPSFVSMMTPAPSDAASRAAASSHRGPTCAPPRLCSSRHGAHLSGHCRLGSGDDALWIGFAPGKLQRRFRLFQLRWLYRRRWLF